MKIMDTGSKKMKTDCRSGAFGFNDKIYPCTLSVAMDLVGGKWKAVILYHLQDGAKRFGELHTRLHNATEAVLSRCLQQLERDGLVSRQQAAVQKRIRADGFRAQFSACTGCADRMGQSGSGGAGVFCG